MLSVKVLAQKQNGSQLSTRKESKCPDHARQVRRQRLTTVHMSNAQRWSLAFKLTCLTGKQSRLKKRNDTNVQSVAKRATTYKRAAAFWNPSTLKEPTSFSDSSSKSKKCSHIWPCWRKGLHRRLPSVLSGGLSCCRHLLAVRKTRGKVATLANKIEFCFLC